MKQRAMRSDLVYTVTAGPDGTHLIHLMSTPGSPFSYGPRNGGVSSGWLDRFVNCVVWYTYYDTTDDNVDECRRNNPDVYLSPDQVPLDSLEYSYMNDATKAIIRQWLVAEAKILLGIIEELIVAKYLLPMPSCSWIIICCLIKEKKRKRKSRKS